MQPIATFTTNCQFREIIALFLSCLSVSISRHAQHTSHLMNLYWHFVFMTPYVSHNVLELTTGRLVHLLPLFTVFLFFVSSAAQALLFLRCKNCDLPLSLAQRQSWLRLHYNLQKLGERMQTFLLRRLFVAGTKDYFPSKKLWFFHPNSNEIPRNKKNRRNAIALQCNCIQCVCCQWQRVRAAATVNGRCSSQITSNNKCEFNWIHFIFTVSLSLSIGYTHSAFNNRKKVYFSKRNILHVCCVFLFASLYIFLFRFVFVFLLLLLLFLKYFFYRNYSLFPWHWLSWYMRAFNCINCARCKVTFFCCSLLSLCSPAINFLWKSVEVSLFAVVNIQPCINSAFSLFFRSVSPLIAGRSNSRPLCVYDIW